jgi:hypothetical protein
MGRAAVWAVPTAAVTIAALSRCHAETSTGMFGMVAATVVR